MKDEEQKVKDDYSENSVGYRILPNWMFCLVKLQFLHCKAVLFDLKTYSF